MLLETRNESLGSSHTNGCVYGCEACWESCSKNDVNCKFVFGIPVRWSSMLSGEGAFGDSICLWGDAWWSAALLGPKDDTCNSKPWGKWKWTMVNPLFSAMHLSGYSWDEGSTLPTAFLWWQEGHVTLRSQSSGSVFEHSRETRQKQQKKKRQMSFYKGELKDFLVKVTSESSHQQQNI